MRNFFYGIGNLILGAFMYLAGLLMSAIMFTVKLFLVSIVTSITLDIVFGLDINFLYIGLVFAVISFIIWFYITEIRNM